MNLRVWAEEHLSFVLEDYEGGAALPVVLISPDGVTQEYSVNAPTKFLSGQVLYDVTEQDLDGNDVIVTRPIVTLRRSSLVRVPLDGESWIVKIPETPDPNAAKKTYISYHIYEDGKTLGMIRIDLLELESNVQAPS